MVKSVQTKYKNKSQIFVLDLIFSIIILVVTFTVAFSYYSNQKDNTFIYDLNSNIVNSLTQTKINSLNNDIFIEMFKNGNIKNIDDTIVIELINLIDDNNLNLAQNVTKLFLNNYNIKGTNINITLSNSSNIYNLYNYSDSYLSFNQSEISAVISRKIILYNPSLVDYNIFNLEVKIWQ